MFHFYKNRSFAILSLLLKLNLCHYALSISCYQCDSNQDLECSELFDVQQTRLKPKPCDDVFEAQFCIKTTGMYGGVIGTMRNCSSRDLGDRCSYIKRSGDQRYVRSCVYTCSTDNCNRAPPLQVFPFTSYLLSFIPFISFTNMNSF